MGLNAIFAHLFNKQQHMIIGVPKEIKNNENRVGLTPAGYRHLTKAGHKVFVQATAGLGSGFSDDEYKKAGG
jgi:alanine dehydrogenase